LSDKSGWDAPPSPLQNHLWDLRNAVLDYESARSAHEAGARPFLTVQLRGRTAAMHAERIARLIRKEIKEEA
jgi:hypothetical protein